MKHFIILLFVLLSYVGYYFYTYDKKINKNIENISQIPKHLTSEFWQTVTPEQLKKELKTIKNVNTVRPDTKQNMLHLLVQYGEYPEMLDTLISAGVNYNTTSGTAEYDNSQMTVLCFAINRRATEANKGLEFTKEILKYNVNIKDSCNFDSNKFTPLIVALWVKMPFEIIKSLLEKGSDINYNYRGFTTLMLASASDEEVKVEHSIDPKTIQLLLDYGANITVKNEEGKTAYDYMKEDENFIKTDLFKKISNQFQN